jgi:carbohydrate-selective porin OprB
MQKLRLLCAAFAALTCANCATATQNAKVMSGAFATCAKADLGQAVGPSVTLLSDVASLINGGTAALEQDLESLAITVGVDAVKCAIAAVGSVLEAQPSGSAEGPKARTIPAGLNRARTWAASKK